MPEGVARCRLGVRGGGAGRGVNSRSGVDVAKSGSSYVLENGGGGKGCLVGISVVGGEGSGLVVHTLRSRRRGFE